MITRLRKKLLQDERPAYQIAAELGIHPSTLSQYNLSVKQIQPHHLVKLCRYFKCDPDDLIGWLDEPDIINWIEESKEPETSQ